jgi:hypothetical protein
MLFNMENQVLTENSVSQLGILETHLWVSTLLLHLVLAQEPPFCVLYTSFSQGPFFTASLTSCSIPAVLRISLPIRATRLSSLRVRRAFNKLSFSVSQSCRSAFSDTNFPDRVKDLFKVVLGFELPTAGMIRLFSWLKLVTSLNVRELKSPSTIRGGVYPVRKCFGKQPARISF